MHNVLPLDRELPQRRGPHLSRPSRANSCCYLEDEGTTAVCWVQCAFPSQVLCQLQPSQVGESLRSLGNAVLSA